MLLIAVGVFKGFSNGFRGSGWGIMILVGGVFLLDDIIPGFKLQRYTWPVVIIAAGLLMLIRPKRRCNNKWRKYDDKWKEKADSYKDKYSKKYSDTYPEKDLSEDYFDSTSIFGGTKKVILSKNFKVGDITCIMGGCEVDFTQADIQGSVIIDSTVIFGGIKITVPPNWSVRNQITTVFGNVEDKRTVTATNPDPNKILVLTGTLLFGGVEIRNY
jgi:predicted membrane protein